MNEQLLEHLISLRQMMAKIRSGKMHGLNWYRILEPILDKIIEAMDKPDKT